jgi:zinc/manganese transport system substrate-binding protein
MRIRHWAAGVLALTLFGSAGGGGAAAAVPAKVKVVAAEDFWGSIARQLGGERVDVTSIVSDPDTDPHAYEATPQDGAALATAQVAVVNGIGYDRWADKLLAASPSSARRVVRVGDVAGVREGGNPHQWYSPSSVRAVIDAITAALKEADPAGAAYFDARRQAYEADGLKRYDDLRARIRAQYAGTTVGASESIFAPLARDLGLTVLTPESFLEAISEGNEPTARDKATVDRQITGRQIKVFVYNSQNSTPDVAALVEKAEAAGIPVATVTETLTPRGALFQDWQADQLQRLADALARAGGSTAAAGGASPAPATPAAAPGTGAARTGPPGRRPVLLAGAALVLGGLVLLGRAVPHRRRSGAHDPC